MALDYLLGGIIAFTVLVAIHEFGHYSVARLCGVRVLTFSIGFGSLLWQRTDAAGTMWRISALPLGGYVKLLNRHTLNELPEEQREGAQHSSIETKAWWQKVSIVVAGPLINLIFAALLFACLHVSGTYHVRPVVGDLSPESPAARAGVNAQDAILAVNNTAVRSWRDVQTILEKLDLKKSEQSLTLTIQASDGVIERAVFFDTPANQTAQPLIALIGLVPSMPPLSVELAQVVPDSPAARAGFRVGDEIVGVDGIKVTHWQQVSHTIADRPNTTVAVTVMRASERLVLRPTIGTRDLADGVLQDVRGYLGVMPMPAPHDRNAYFIKVRENPFSAFFLGVQDMWDITMRIVHALWEMVSGQSGVDGLGGPVTIVAFAGESFANGMTQFVQFMALLSISLGVFNLLPLPLLDGGHIVIYTLEALRGKRFSERAEQRFFRFGAACIFALIVLALFNDIVRFFFA